jgi:transposase InsO family protein
MKTDYPVRQLCNAFAVSASGYYAWCQRLVLPSAHAQEDARLSNTIADLFQANRQTYGSPRIQAELKHGGRSHGRNRIARLMRQQGLCGRPAKRFKVRTTDSNHDQPIAPNRLPELDPPTRPNQVWIGDITYIATEEGWLYLAGIEDLFSRRIVGWSMSENIDTPLVLAAWKMACTQRKPDPGLVFHSDRGVQYASKDYRRSLENTQAIASMSRRGNCYDNATMESFWSTLKHELIYRRVFQTRAEARHAIFDYIETFYNRLRLHSSLNYYSPIDFENQMN